MTDDAFCAVSLDISAELRTQSYSVLIFCWKFPLALAGGGWGSRATTIFPANFLANFFLGDPHLSFCLSRSTGLTQKEGSNRRTTLGCCTTLVRTLPTCTAGMSPTGCPRSRPRVSLSIYVSVTFVLPAICWQRHVVNLQGRSSTVRPGCSYNHTSEHTLCLWNERTLPVTRFLGFTIRRKRSSASASASGSCYSFINRECIHRTLI